MYRNQILTARSNLSYFEYFAVFLLVFYAGKANMFVLALENWDNLIGLMLPVLIIAILGLIKCILFTHKYWLFILGFTLYFVASTLKFGELHPQFYGIQIITFTLAYVVISALRLRFFLIYENILYFLCIIALCFWVLQNMFPSSFVALLRNFEFSTQKDINGNVDFNTIVYTISNFEFSREGFVNIGGIKLIRNAGFAWEPGAFACFINIAILMNLIRNKFKLKDNKHLLVFIAALITTFSTTGYSLFVITTLFFTYNQTIVKVIWLGPVIVIVTIYLFTLPFMQDKIIKSTKFQTDKLVYNSAKYNSVYGPQRFESLKIDFIDFLNHPLIGYGGHQDARWTNQMGAQIATVSGIGKIMAQFGILGTLFFLISLWQSSKQIITIYNVKGILFPVIFVLLISVSYGVMTPLLMCIWLLNLSSFYRAETFRKYLISKVVKSISA